MAIDFDASSAHFSVPDHADFTLSATTGWTIIEFVRNVAANDQANSSGFQYCHSRGNYNVANSVNFYAYQQQGGNPSSELDYRTMVNDSLDQSNDTSPSGGTTGESISNDLNNAFDGVWRIVALRFDPATNTIEQVQCDVNGAAIVTATFTDVNWADVNGGDLIFGARADLNSARFYHGETFRSTQYDSPLDNLDIEFLAGNATGDPAGHTPVYNFPWTDSATVNSTVGGHVATRNGALAGTTPDPAFGGGMASPTITADFSLGNCDPSTLTVDQTDPAEPIIRFGFYPTNDSSHGARAWGRAARLDGVQGTRPIIRLDDTPNGWGNNHDHLWFSTHVDGPYSQLDTTAFNGSGYVGFQGASAFTANTVYLFSAVPHTTGFIANWVAGLFASHAAVTHRVQSDLNFTTDPTTGVVAQVAGSTTYWGKPIPTLPQYGFRLSDDTASPAGGKRIAVMIGHQHAGEYTGVHFLRSFVDWLVAGSAPANKLLDEWAFYIYPQTNVNGAYGGHFRGTFEDGDADPAGSPTQDTNRDWDVTTSVLTSVQNIKDAIATDVGQTDINLFFDHHSFSGNPDPILYVGQANAKATSLMTAANGYDSEIRATPSVNAFGDSAATWANPAISSDGYFTQVDVSGTMEFSTERGYDEADMTRLASAWGQAINDRMTAGDYPPVASGCVVNIMLQLHLTNVEADCESVITNVTAEVLNP